MTENTLSVCTIVKDEERCLARCLDSVQPVADEIIIVDTGSSDRTVEIARQYTEQVFFHPWNDDFSEARNVSLSYATRDWILQVDADEVLEQEDIPLLRRTVQTSESVAINVALHNKLPDGLSVHYFPRLFRRGRAHYEGIVHNQLIYDGLAETAEIRIHHDGYNLDPQAMARKYQRTATLLQRHLRESPGDMMAMAQLVRVYREWGRFDKVLEHVPPSLNRCAPDACPNAHHMLVSDLAYALMQVDRLGEGVQVCRAALRVHAQSIDLWFILAGLHFRRREFPQAAEALHQFLDLHALFTHQVYAHQITMVGTYGQEAQAWHNLGTCYQAMGQPDEAIRSFANACSVAPRRPVYRLVLAQALAAKGRDIEARTHLHETIPLLEEHLAAHTDDAGAMNNLATCYLLLGRREAARLGYQATLAIDPAFLPAQKGLELTS